MADPVTAALIITAAGVAVSAYSQYQTGVQQRRAARVNARALEAQAEAEASAANIEALQQERAAEQAGLEAQREAEYQEFRERREREQQRFLAGTIIAQTAASGLLLEGSPLFVLEENLRQAELGLLASRTESEARQLGLRTEQQTRDFAADITRFQGAQRLRLGRLGARIQRFEGEQAFQAGLLRSGGTVLAGGGQLFRQEQRRQSIRARTLPASSRPVFRQPLIGAAVQ